MGLLFPPPVSHRIVSHKKAFQKQHGGSEKTDQQIYIFAGSSTVSWKTLVLKLHY